MSHVHAQLRGAVAARVTGLATTGARVFQERVYPLQAAEMPGLCVWVPGDSASELNIHPPSYQRDTDVTLAGYAKAVTGVENVLDAIKSEAEAALASLETIGGRPIYLRYQGCRTQLSPEGDMPHAIVTITYRATLFTAAGSPDVLL